jgi:hypothetical protein
MYSDTFEENFLKYIDLLPQDSLQFLFLNATPMPEDRWEAPWVNSSTIRFDSVKELRTYVQKCIQENLRIMSLNAVYKDKSFIHFEIQIPKVKVFKRIDALTPNQLHEAGLLGAGKLIEIYELAF